MIPNVLANRLGSTIWLKISSYFSVSDVTFETVFPLLII